MKTRLLAALFAAAAAATVAADEGMWRFDQLPLDAIAKRYGVRLTPVDVAKLQNAPVRIRSGGGGGTGTFASPNGLILTNHHVALDCIRTSTLAEQSKGKADNLIERGFTAKSMGEELACRRFRVQIERSSKDVTAELNADVRPGMPMADIQRARQQKRSDLERACAKEKGTNFTCSVTDFNSGAWSRLIVYEDFNDIRLVYAPEKQLGYFGGDEMNFRFPRYASDISILRAYVGKDGGHGEYDAAHVPYRPDFYLPVTLDGIKEGDVTFVSGNPGNTNRYRLSNSAVYNIKTGMPNQIADLEAELALLRKYAALKDANQVLLQERIFGLANSLKYTQDVLAALKSSNVVAKQQQREQDFLTFIRKKPALQTEYGSLFEEHKQLYATQVEKNADLDSALDWIQRTTVVGYAVGLYDFAEERAKPSDREREPQFQERFWPDIRQGLLTDEPTIPELEIEVLALGLKKAMALPPDQQIAAVSALKQRGGSADPSALARAIVSGSKLATLEARKALLEAPVPSFEQSTDPAIVFAGELRAANQERRARTRILNETLFQHRAKFARGLMAWKGQTMYPDANFTLRVTYGKAAGYTDPRGDKVPFATTFGDMFALAYSRGNKGDFALPPSLTAWRSRIGETAFARYATMLVDFVTTNDITGGNSGSATLNKKLEIVGLIFDGNEEAMAGDWAYSEEAGRALSTDIRFALTLARDVHGAGWVVDELTTRR